MGEWKPGQKLVGPDGQRRAIFLGPASTTGYNAVAWDSTGWYDTLIIQREWTPVDDWPDPVAEARERVAECLQEYCCPDIEEFMDNNAADLRVLLNAQDAE